MSDQVGIERATRKLGRIFFYWCVGFGMIILLAFQSLTALIVPSTADYDSPGIVALAGGIAFAILVMYIGATTFKLSHCEKRVIETREASVRIVVLLGFSALALVRGVWWVIDIAAGNADSIFNYVGMAWFLVAGVLGIPLALMLMAVRKQVRQLV